jgi:hypothetical protein
MVSGEASRLSLCSGSLYWFEARRGSWAVDGLRSPRHYDATQ